MKNIISKKLREISIKYTYDYQHKVFKIYLEKFIKKFIKLLTNHKSEHDELLPYINIHQNEINVLHAYLNIYKVDIIKLLTYYYCINRNNSSKNRIYYFDQYELVRKRVDSNIRHLLYLNFMDNLPDQYKLNVIIHLFLNNLCQLASSMRYGFLISDITAKTKTTEHWISRLPLFLICSIVIIFGKSYNYMLNNVHIEYTYIIADTLVSLGMGTIAIFLIYMRVPQSIYADAKKSASDIYIYQKTLLHFNILNETSQENVEKYFDKVYNEFFLEKNS